MFTGEGFSLNLGFRNSLCSQTMDSILFQVSQKKIVHKRILYFQKGDLTYILNSNRWWYCNADKNRFLECWEKLYINNAITCLEVRTKKSHIRETLTLTACADSITDTMKSCFFATFLHFGALFVTFLAMVV